MTENPCPVCGESITPERVKRGRTYCGKSCSVRARGSAFRGIVCSQENCYAPIKGLGLCAKHYRRLKVHGRVTPDLPTEAERFAAKYAKGGPDECWEWTGGRLTNVFCTYADGVTTRHFAHRYALASRGVTIDGLVVRHKCDNPPCVNPNHLETGTQADNIADAVERGRLDLTGLRSPYPQACRRCGTGFLGLPSARYCSLECRVAVSGTKSLTPDQRKRFAGLDPLERKQIARGAA